MADLLKELEDEVQRIGGNLLESYDWIDDTFDINFLEFWKKSFWSIDWFRIYMDNSAKWGMLAFELGLTSDEIEWCSTYHKDGPTKEVFSRLKQKGELENLSLGHILSLVKKLELKDILKRITWQEGIDNFRIGLTENVSDSLTIPIAYSMESTPSMAPASFTLNIHHTPEIMVASANEGQVADSQIQQCNKTPTAGKKPGLKFAVKIIMIFASDAREEALRAADQLRVSKEQRKAIGIMTLTPANSPKIENSLLADPGNSIHKWFNQVDYIVPVLSPQFLCQIQDRDSDPHTLNERQYNRYLYRLLMDDYVARMSKNVKCRALCPAKYCTEVRNSELVKGNGLLQMNWDCSSNEQLEQLCEILISGAKERRRRK